MADGTDAGVFWSSFASCPVPWERRVPFDLRRGYEPCGICLVGLRSSLAICKEDSCLLRKKGSEPDPRVSLCSLDSRCCGCLVMGTCSSGENSIVKVMPVKARKPYTIRKQRERWTEDEHNKFLEALKLYGRAWQRIEEHIGTKTAVQIRSHAQKFFSKLEKEAVAKGIPLEKVHDIEIPPPRPKRKPNKPYPRKICVGTVSTCVEGKDDRPIASLSSRKNILELGRDSHRKKHTLIQSLERTKGTSKASKCSDSLSLFQDAASCTSVPLACKGPIDACTFREFVPLVKEIKGKTTDDEYSSTVKERVPNNTNSDIDRPERLSIDTEMNLPKEVIVGREPPQKYCIPLNNEIEGCKNYPKYVFVDPIDGDGSKTVKSRGPNATNLTSISNKFGVDTNSNFGTIPSISATTGHHDSTSLFSVHQPFVAFSPLTQFFGMEDAYRSFLNISPTFSSLIISSLLQIPAAHAAASLATSLWPTVDVEAPIDSVSETIGGRIPVRCMNPSPSMETTASVSSWGATHGMLPFCHPGHSCFTFVPAPVNIIPRTGTSQTVEDNKEKEVEVSHHCAQTNQQTVDLKLFEAPRSKSFPLSSSDSDQSWEGENHYAVEQRSLTFNHPNSKPDSFLLEVNKAPLNHLPSTDTSNCWSRGSHSVSESPKEATKEGGLAFRALFSKEVLTQSFLPSRTEDRMMENDKDEKHVAALPVEANSSTLATANDDHAHVADRSCSTNAGNNTKKGLLTDEIGQGKLKSPKTGFKPYKRCSIEARENKAAPHEEKCNKKIRLDGDTSL